MGNTNKGTDLLNYINKPMSREGIDMIYRLNNIKFERCELYNDFVQSLMMLVFDTYMGDEITKGDDQINHFKWCFNKTVSNFKEEGINFEHTAIYDYFLEFMLEVYYPLTKKRENPNTHKNLLKLWGFIFDFNNLKSNSDIDTFIEVYRIFDKSLIK